MVIDFNDFREQILDEKEEIIIPEGIAQFHNDIIEAYKSGRAIENVLLPIYNNLDNDLLSISDDYINEGINQILDIFETRVFEILEHEKSDFEKRRLNNTNSNVNLYEFANTLNLYLSNKYTRVISENLGHKLEDIATLSPKVINPEIHLGFKIKGIDIIVYHNSNFYFCQLKTKKDTLTGSQKGRSETELSIHPRSIFVACLSLGKSFTFNSQKAHIGRIHGKTFWDLIDIDYSLLMTELTKSLQEIEDKLFNQED